MGSLTNADLAALATRRAQAEPRCPGGTLARRGALCAAVALRTTETLARARAVLDAVPSDVRDAALACIDALAAENARYHGPCHKGSTGADITTSGKKPTP